MTTLNTAQARVIDPILTTHVQGYQNAEFVGMMLFPTVDTPNRQGKVIEFGTEAFRLYNTKRAPGGDVKRIEFGYEGKPFLLDQHALEGKVPIEHQEEAQAVPGIDLGRTSVDTVMRTIMLSLEVEQATLARDAAKYDANHKLAYAPGAQWSDAAVNPTRDIDDARDAIRASCGMRPNTMILSPAAFRAARNNPNVVERFKYVSKDSITLAMLAALWEIEMLSVGDAIFVPEGNADRDFVDVWGADAVFAYVPKATGTGAPARDRAVPSFGYTYRLRGHPIVEAAYYEKSVKSWCYPVTYERAPQLTGIVAGFLFQNTAPPILS